MPEMVSEQAPALILSQYPHVAKGVLLHASLIIKLQVEAVVNVLTQTQWDDALCVIGFGDGYTTSAALSLAHHLRTSKSVTVVAYDMQHTSASAVAHHYFVTTYV